jgi:tetratricopeptide (TPR) repeat protein
MRIGLCHLLLLIPCLAGCQTLAQPPGTAKEALTMAAGFLEAGEPDKALAVLDATGDTNLSLDDKSQFYLLVGTAEFRRNDPWAGYGRIRDFVQKHQFRRHSQELADLMFQIGETLALSDAGFLFFWSNRVRGRAVLKDFVSHYPTNPHENDAQYRLGEMSFEDGDYEDARQRFAKIIFDSVWSTKAAFRVAMCYYRALEGPDYDLGEMEKAKNELTDFLASRVENPAYRAAAEQALSTVRAWLARKHVLIADFYFEVGNQRGGRHHLRLASGYGDTAPGERARRRLAATRDRVEATSPLPGATPPPDPAR